MSRLFDDFGDENPESLLGAGSAHAAKAEPESLPVPAPQDGSLSLAASLLGDVAETAPEPVQQPAVADQLPAKPAKPAYEIPDFEKDAKALEAFEDAKKRYQRQQIASAEATVQREFSQRREQLQAEIRNARSFRNDRQKLATLTARDYAERYPHRVDRKGVYPPSFFENLFSFGRAGTLYKAALIAGESLDSLKVGIRKREDALGALESQLSRAIYLKEESIKKSFDTQAGLDEFHARPEVRTIFERMERVRLEREEYAARLAAGEVSDEEQRDRAMAEHKLEYALKPIEGAVIGKVLRFGNLTYFLLRNLNRKETLLSYDPRLDPLRNSVFDLFVVANKVGAKLRRTDTGAPFRVADHFKACWRDQDKAEELYAEHRAALRDDRGLARVEPRDEEEADIIDRLAQLAQSQDTMNAAADSAQDGPSLHL